MTFRRRLRRMPLVWLKLKYHQFMWLFVLDEDDEQFHFERCYLLKRQLPWA